MTKNRDWKNWAKCAGIRAIKTVAQTAIFEEFYKPLAFGEE